MWAAVQLLVGVVAPGHGIEAVALLLPTRRPVAFRGRHVRQASGGGVLHVCSRRLLTS